jgi:hypothetical protein
MEAGNAFLLGFMTWLVASGLHALALTLRLRRASVTLRQLSSLPTVASPLMSPSLFRPAARASRRADCCGTPFDVLPIVNLLFQ